MEHLLIRNQHSIIPLFHPHSKFVSLKEITCFNILYKWRNINPDRFSGRWPEPLAVGANLIPP